MNKFATIALDPNFDFGLYFFYKSDFKTWNIKDITDITYLVKT